MSICPWLEGPTEPTRCCEFWAEVKECHEPNCLELNDGTVPRWHSAFYCPFCRGEGTLVKEVTNE